MKLRVSPRTAYVQLIAVVDEGGITQWRVESRDFQYRLRQRAQFSGITDGGSDLAKVKALDALEHVLEAALSESASLGSEKGV